MDWAVPDRVIFAKKLTAVGVETHRAAVGYRDSFILDDIAFAVDGEKTLRCRRLRANNRPLAVPRDLKRRHTAAREEEECCKQKTHPCVVRSSIHRWPPLLE